MPRAHSVRVQLPNEVRDCALHPSTDLLFSGTLQGQLHCHRLVQPADVLESLDVQIGYAGPGCDSCFIQAEEVWEQEVDNGERGACRSLALSQDGSTAAVGTASTEILLVDTQAGKEKGSIADEAIFEPSNVQEDPEQNHETSLHRLSYMGQHLVSGVHTSAVVCSTGTCRATVQFTQTATRAIGVPRIQAPLAVSRMAGTLQHPMAQAPLRRARGR